MNKSLIAMRKAGLVKATAFSPEQAKIANDYVIHAADFCAKKNEATLDELHQSYLLGLRGVRIGREAQLCNS